MEPNNLEPQKRIRELKEDPQYFGGYLNMARLNIFNISNHVAEALNISKINEDGEIKNSFLCNKENKKINWSHAYSKARRFMPLLKVFDFESLPEMERLELGIEKNTGKDFPEMSDALKNLFSDLQEFRNDYSHYYNPAKKTERKLTISKETEAFLNTNLKRAIEYTKTRFEGVLHEDDFNLIKAKKIIGENGKITTEGLVFFISMFLEREYAFQFIGKIKGLKGTQFQSFIATREVLMAYCVNLPNDKIISTDMNQAFMLDLINELNRCPKTLYNVLTEEAKQRFKPKLEDSAIQNIFANSINSETDLSLDDFDQYIEDLTKRIRRENRFTYFALRFIDHKDLFKKYRFQLDLGKLKLGGYDKTLNGIAIERKIVENVKVFGKLSEFSAEYDAIKLIDKQNILKGFEQFAPCYNISNNKIGISSDKPGTKALKAINEEKKAKINLIQHAPQAFLSLHELSKIILLEYLQPGLSEKIISDFILVNNNQLMNLGFIEEIKAKMPNDWNTFNRRSDSRKTKAYQDSSLKYLRSRKDILNEVLNAYGLNDKQIPSRIVDYWLNINDVNKDSMFSDRIKLMKRDCMDRLKAISKGKGPKIGEMATFIAKDIVDMVISKEKKGKITSFYYDKIQECIALFADYDKKQLLISLITELGLNEIDGHPFLRMINIQSIRYTRDLYSAYLIEKGHKMVEVYDPVKKRNKTTDKSWLFLNFYHTEWNQKNKKNQTVVKLPSGTSKIPHSILQLIDRKPSDLKQWLHNITQGKDGGDGKKPLNLPTNLFDNALIDLLTQDLESMNFSDTLPPKYNQLFKLWWKYREDDVQPFYNAEREYMVYNKFQVMFKPDSSNKYSDYYKEALNKAFNDKQAERLVERNKLIRNGVPKHIATGKLPDIAVNELEKSFQKAIANTEKEIRLLQEEDRLVLLMIENLLDKGSTQGLKLSSIDALLTEQYQIKQMVTGKLHFDENGQEIKDKSNPYITKFITATRKRKAYGVLRKFIFDRRLPELFEYFSEDEIPLEVLKIELDAYNNARQVVLDRVFELEKALIDKYEQELILLSTKNDINLNQDPIQHKTYLTFLLNKGFIGSDELTFMNMTRNCFSHNQFPQRKTMEIFLHEWRTNNIPLQIASIYDQKTKELIDRL